MNRRRLLLSAFTAAACLVFGVEAMHWARHGTRDALAASYPSPALDREWEPVFYRDRVVGDGPHERITARTIWDARRRVVAELRSDQPSARAWNTIWLQPWRAGRRAGPDRTFDTPGFLGDRFARPEPGALLLRRMQEIRPRWRWAWEGGALLGRHPSSGAVLSAIGPAGSFESLETLGEDRFGDLHFEDGYGFDTVSFPLSLRLVDATHDRRVSITMDRSDRLDQPPLLDIRLTPLVADIPTLGSGVPEPVSADELRPIQTPGRVRWVDARGHVRVDVALDAGERVVQAGVIPVPDGGPVPDDPFSWSGRRALAAQLTTTFQTDDVLAEATRVRVQRLGRPLVRHDLVWVPTGVGQHVLEGLACLPLALRPLPSAVASFLSPAPIDDLERGAAWWWRDPVVAGGHRPLALAANVLVALACAALAFRLGRRHCATSAQARLCAVVGLLAGPIGLLWLRLTVVRAATDAVVGSRRSLALDVSPSSSAPWPVAAPKGHELIHPVEVSSVS